jgi:hypothetical protein
VHFTRAPFRPSANIVCNVTVWRSNGRRVTLAVVVSEASKTPEEISTHPGLLALTRLQAAEALNVSPATLDRLTLRGLLRPSRAIRRPLYAIAEIERFLRETT